ncbi:MAG: molecular chaperone TorD family protein [Betaproteobacteria bacterium]|nr:molecular chaperone TorD family protein [Betaproteobacteria bacterium]
MLDAPLRAALAEDLEQLIRLHDRELDEITLKALSEVSFPENFALLPRAGTDLLHQALNASAPKTRDRPQGQGGANENPAPSQFLDLLAADYAAIYLSCAFGASPYESVWLSEDHLACEQPMFELREIYARHGLKVSNWRQRYDDHFVLQMQFLLHRLRAADTNWPEVGNILDEHLLYWIGDFAARVAGRCNTPFYAGLVLATVDWLEQVRDLIAEQALAPRLSREEVSTRLRERIVAQKEAVAPLKFMPGGAGPSW